MHKQTFARKPYDATCLIVEDSQFDQRLLKRVVAQSQARIRSEVATSLMAARSILSSTPVSLLLLDNRLPDGIGAEFALELSVSPKYAHIPIILVSDWPTPFMWEKAAAAGVLYVVNKAEFGVPYIEQALQRGASKRAQVS